MRLIEVQDKKSRKEFLQVPKLLYRKDEPWICPLDKEIEKIFDPNHNFSFKEGEAIRWILKSDDGKLIGRIAAFYNLTKSNAQIQPTGGMGFFESIDSQEVAFKLFEAGKIWLKSKGMEACDAPVNFGENESHWGLLVEGFTQPGFGMPYHKPYYQKFFEEYGFKNYFEQYSYHKDVTSVTEFPERFMKIAAWVARKPGYSFRHLRMNEIDTYLNDLIAIYSATWSHFKKDFTPLDKGKLLESFQEAKAFIDEELIWFAYHEQKPVAFYIIYPDLNQILKHFNGQLHLWNKIRFLYLKKRHTMTRVRALIAGVDPQYQNIGLESVIFKKLYEVFRKKPYYKELELSWVGDYNPKMISIYEALGAHQAKKHITYRLMFHTGASFIRFKDEIKTTQP